MDKEQQAFLSARWYKDKCMMDLQLNFDISFAPRLAGWSARSRTLGIVAFGNTQDDAEDRAYEIIDHLLRVLYKQGGLDLVRKHLDAMGVQHSITYGRTM